MTNDKKPQVGEAKSIKYKYIFNKDYNPVYINGVYGGFTANNELNANFFLERGGLPKHEIFKINNGKLSSTPDERKPDISQEHLFVRVVSHGIVVSYDQAKIIRDWFIKHITDYEKAQEKIKGDS